jgi:hypothetical protein
MSVFQTRCQYLRLESCPRRRTKVDSDISSFGVKLPADSIGGGSDRVLGAIELGLSDLAPLFKPLYLGLRASVALLQPS